MYEEDMRQDYQKLSFYNKLSLRRVYFPQLISF